MTTGKWAQPGVPHKGWVCVGIDDLGAPSAICEMCEVVQVRYVHHMQHPDYTGVLGCGCICAGHMEQNKQAAEARERRVENRANRRKNFLARKTWRTSVKGNPWIRVDGYHVVVFPYGGRGYTLIVTTPENKKAFGHYVYSTRERAQLAAFDAVMFLKDQPQ